MTLEKWLADTAERAGSTLVQAAIIYVLAATQIDGDFWRGLITVLVTGVANVLVAAVTAWVPLPTVWWHDMAWRAVRTFAISLFGSLASVEWLDLVSMSWWTRVVVAAGMAALAVVKAVFAKQYPNTITPASLARG